MEEDTGVDPLAYIKQLEMQKDQAVAGQNQMAGVTNSMFASSQDPNLIEWQLELDNILERVEHLLKGDVLKQDNEGNIYYETPKDENLRPLNEYGVQFLMNVLSFYLNRNTILSNYDSERINEIMYDLGYELNDQIYLNAEKLGLDNPDKRKRYPMVVLEIVHTIESAYNRAYKGQERESLRSARVVTQSDNVGNNLSYPGVSSSPAKVKMFSPSTWFRN